VSFCQVALGDPWQLALACPASNLGPGDALAGIADRARGPGADEVTPMAFREAASLTTAHVTFAGAQEAFGAWPKATATTRPRRRQVYHKQGRAGALRDPANSERVAGQAGATLVLRRMIIGNS
jgi:hypothetical protein